MENLIVTSLGVMMLSSAWAVIVLKNPVFSILWLICLFCLAASLLLLLNVEFLAMVLLIVYIGAIMVLFLFIVMMIKIKGLEISFYKEKFSIFHTCGLILLIFIISVIILVNYFDFLIMPIELRYGFMMYSEVITVINKLPNVVVLGLVLYTYFSPILLISSLSLLVAMLGSIFLTLSVNDNPKKQNLFEQQVRNYRNTLIIKQINKKLNV